MIQTIAIDDEPLALQLVSGYIKKTPFLNLVASLDNPLSAIDLMNKQNIDLIFLDIQMPDLTGTSFARTLTKGTKIIFTTAFEKYALEGFKLDAVDYLLKPFSYEEFLVAAQKAKKLIDLEQHSFTGETNQDFLFLKSEYKVVRINFNDIRYIEGQKDYIKVFLKGETEPLLSLSTLKSIEKKLPETLFMRVHRSFIVNLNFVSAIERSRILFGKTYIPIGDQYRDKFQKFINNNTL